MLSLGSGDARWVEVTARCPACLLEFRVLDPTRDDEGGEDDGGESFNKEFPNGHGRAPGTPPYKPGQKSSYQTTTDNGHTHSVDLPDDGNGETDTAMTHKHDVFSWVIQPQAGHTHEILDGPVEPKPRDMADNGSDEEDGIMDIPESEMVKFLTENPNPTDHAFHEHSEEKGWNNREAESVAYKLATRYVQFRTGGASKGKRPGNIISSEEMVGVQVELEHTPNIDDANKIVWDHLAEVKNSKYYSFLVAIEKILKLGPEHELYKKMEKIVEETKDLPRP